MDEEKEAKKRRLIVETSFWLGLAIVVLSFLYDQAFIVTIPVGLACMILAGLESLLSKVGITKKISKFEETSKILLFLILNLMIVFTLKTRLPSWRKTITMLLQLPPTKTWWINAILGLIAGLILLFILTNFYLASLERKAKKLVGKPKEKVVKAILEEIRGWPRRPKKEIFKKIPLKGEIPEEVIKRYEKLIEARLHMKNCIERAIKKGYSLEKIREIARDLGWPEEEIQRLSKEVIKLGRKYIYFVFFLLGAALIVACILDQRNYTILMGIAIMLVALLSYPRIKIKRLKPKKEGEVKIKPKKFEVKVEIPKISFGERLRSIFRRRVKPPKEKIKIKPKKPEEKVKPKISFKEKIRSIFKKRIKIKGERKRWKEKERERKEREREKLREEGKEKREKKVGERKKKIIEFKEGISLGRLFRRRIKPLKEEIKPEKPVKEKIKAKKEDLGLIKAIRESVTKAEKNETNLDTLFKLVKKYGRLRLSTVAIGFKIGKNQAEEWARILEEHKLARTHYPAIGDPEIRKIEEVEKEEPEKTEKEKSEEAEKKSEEAKKEKIKEKKKVKKTKK